MASSNGARGTYPKGIAKRAEILDVALSVIAREGFGGATVKQLADAVGLSQNGLLRYFGSKDALFIEVIRHHEELVELENRAENIDYRDGFSARVIDALTQSMSAAGMSLLLLSMTMVAADETHPGHPFFKHRYAAFREIVAGAFRSMQTHGEFPRDGDPDAAATLLVAAFDGLQVQRLYDQTIDVPGRMAYFLRTLGVVDGVTLVP